jgi:hypothetical protein
MKRPGVGRPAPMSETQSYEASRGGRLLRRFGRYSLVTAQAAVWGGRKPPLSRVVTRRLRKASLCPATRGFAKGYARFVGGNGRRRCPRRWLGRFGGRISGVGAGIRHAKVPSSLHSFILARFARPAHRTLTTGAVSRGWPPHRLVAPRGMLDIHLMVAPLTAASRCRSMREYDCEESVLAVFPLCDGPTVAACRGAAQGVFSVF